MGQGIDCHSHSEFSPDGKDSVAAMCDRALELGVSVYGLSDHCEIDYYEVQSYEKRLQKSWAAMRQQKERFADKKMKLLAGVEIGQTLKNPVLAAKVAAQAPDFVLLSLHRTRNIADFSFLDYTTQYASPESRKALLDTYYSELLEMACESDYDILAHLSYPLRYMSHLGVTIDEQAELIDEILRTLVRRGKALEINTSGLRAKDGFTMPDYSIVCRFHKLGGEFLSIGSDAHCAAHLGVGLQTACEMAEKAGFRFLTYFEKRQAQPLALSK